MTDVLPHQLLEPRTDHALVFSVPGLLPTLNEIIDKAGTVIWVRGYKKGRQVYAKKIGGVWVPGHMIHSTSSSYKKKAEERVREALMVQRISCQTPGLWVFAFEFYLPDRRKDKDNVGSGARKIVLDAIQPIRQKNPLTGKLLTTWPGLIPNDGWSHVEGFEKPIYKVDKQSPRTVVKMSRVG